MIPTTTYEDIFTLVEDILRLDPWHRLPADQLLLLEAAENPHAYVTVAFHAEDNRRDLSFLLGEGGLRAHLDMTLKSGAEKHVAECEQHRLFVTTGEIALQDEEHVLRNHSPLIALRRQSPGSQPTTLLEATDLTYLSRFLRALRHILRHESNIAPAHLDAMDRITIPTWQLINDNVQKIEKRRLSPFKPSPRKNNHIDEFTNYRISRLPVDKDERELFIYYLPLKKNAMPRVFFLVNLESGMIEWHDFQSGENWMSPMLRHLYNHFNHIGAVPATILTTNIGAYNTLYQDLTDAGIYFEALAESFVADELINAYIPHLSDK